mgnify:CR=1 FL=1
MGIAKIFLWALICFWIILLLCSILSYWSFCRREKKLKREGQWHLQHLPSPGWDLPIIVPLLLVISWSMCSLLFREPHLIWGLPSTWWYTVGSLLAVLVSLIEYLRRAGKSEK